MSNSEVPVDDTTTWWCLKAGRRGVLEQDWLEQEIVTVGWGNAAGDFRNAHPEEFRENDPSPYYELSKFIGYHDEGMEEGDIVIAYASEKGHVTGVGRVGKVRYDEEHTWRYLTSQEAEEAKVDDHYYWRDIDWFDWGTPVSLSNLDRRFQSQGTDQLPTPLTLNRYGTLQEDRNRIESLVHDIQAAEQIEIAINRDAQTKLSEQQGTSPAPSVWIEKTEVEGRTYKKEGELQLGNAIYSPTQDKQGHDRYAAMRNADVGDIVIHLLQDKGQIVGVSTIESELETDFEGLPEFGWTEDQKGYRRWLTNYHELESPLEIYDDILEKPQYKQTLDQIREEYSNLFYDKNRSLVQGGYFTHCPPELVNLFATESSELRDQLEAHGYEAGPLTDDLEPAGEYDGIGAATKDIRNRIESTPGATNWLRDELGEIIVEDWSTALSGFSANVDVTPERDQAEPDSSPLRGLPG